MPPRRGFRRDQAEAFGRIVDSRGGRPRGRADWGMESVEGQSYIVEQDEARTRLETVEQVCELLDRIAAGETADVSVVIERVPSQSRLRRFFGFSGRTVSPCFILQKAGGAAAITFLDEAWSEYRAIDPDRPVGIGEDVRMQLSFGEPTPADPEVCMSADRAFAAARHYLLHGARPEWLSYRFVR
jgi:hypothetical protein